MNTVLIAIKYNRLQRNYLGELAGEPVICLAADRLARKPKMTSTSGLNEMVLRYKFNAAQEDPAPSCLTFSEGHRAADALELEYQEVLSSIECDVTKLVPGRTKDFIFGIGVMGSVDVQKLIQDTVDKANFNVSFEELLKNMAEKINSYNRKAMEPYQNRDFPQYRHLTKKLNPEEQFNPEEVEAKRQEFVNYFLVKGFAKVLVAAVSTDEVNPERRLFTLSTVNDNYIDEDHSGKSLVVMGSKNVIESVNIQFRGFSETEAAEESGIVRQVSAAIEFAAKLQPPNNITINGKSNYVHWSLFTDLTT